MSNRHYISENDFPPLHRLVVVETKYGALFIGRLTYVSRNPKTNIFDCILRSELQNDGSFHQLYGKISASYIKYWFYYDE